MFKQNFCAFLRGVNVKGTNMKMKEVCDVFSNAGMSGVSAVLASGNILFSSKKEKNILKQLLQKAMREHFDYDANLFIRNAEETATILNSNPFKKSEHLHIYAFVGEEKIEERLMSEFKNTDPQKEEEAKVCNGVFYWQVPKGSTLKPGFGNVLGRKDLKDKMTSRNINTIEKIVKKFKA